MGRAAGVSVDPRVLAPQGQRDADVQTSPMFLHNACAGLEPSQRADSAARWQQGHTHSQTDPIQTTDTNYDLNTSNRQKNGHENGEWLVFGVLYYPRPAWCQLARRMYQHRNHMYKYKSRDACSPSLFPHSFFHPALALPPPAACPL
eukprot:357240-Chlamydomonas_euryale.AAC.4